MAMAKLQKLVEKNKQTKQNNDRKEKTNQLTRKQNDKSRFDRCIMSTQFIYSTCHNYHNRINLINICF